MPVINMPFLLLNEDELRQTINIPEAIAVVEAALVASAQGRINIPGSFSLPIPAVDGNVTVKGTYLHNTPYYVIKIDNHFSHNRAKNLPATSGLITVFDAVTGFPAAILLDNGYLANVRASVMGALATEYLANKNATRVAVIGASQQAFMQLKALLAVRSISHVSVWGQLPHETDTYARRVVEDYDVNIEIAPSVEAAVVNADIIIATCASPQPQVKADWLKPGAHLTAISNCRNNNNPKLHPDALQKADIIVVDSLEQSAAQGEVSHGLANGAITSGHIHSELSSLVLGNIPGRTRPDQITLADLTGLDWQDAIIATLALDKALFLGLGQRMEPGLEQTKFGQRAENLL